MNTNRIETNVEAKAEAPFTQFCLNQCRKLLGEIQSARTRLVNQFKNAFAGQEKLLRLAINEAEALAFLTDYPHLVFPALAMEKVQNAVEWRAHQSQLFRERQRLTSI